MVIIDDFNRTEIQRKYIDHIVGQMDFVEIKRELWNYINREKNRYSNYSLELEISRDAPKILGDELKGSLHLDEYKKAMSPGKKFVKKSLVEGGV